jgi:small subunit ribosomal protein S2
MAIKVSPEKLLEGGAHFGHQAKRWNPKMEEYIFGVQEGIHIFDLIKTQKAIEEALEFITKSVSEGKNILLLGSKKQVKDKIIEVAKETGLAYVSERWLGGTFSNFDQIKRSVKKLADIKDGFLTGKFNKYTKKERLLLDREKARLERYFGGIAGLDKMPEVLFVVDTHKEKSAIKEALGSKVTIIGVVDTNSDPTVIDYPIPMNDDAVKALDYVLDLIKEAVLAGKKKIVKPKKEAVEEK